MYILLMCLIVEVTMLVGYLLSKRDYRKAVLSGLTALLICLIVAKIGLHNFMEKEKITISMSIQNVTKNYVNTMLLYHNITEGTDEFVDDVIEDVEKYREKYRDTYNKRTLDTVKISIEPKKDLGLIGYLTGNSKFKYDMSMGIVNTSDILEYKGKVSTQIIDGNKVVILDKNLLVYNDEIGKAINSDNIEIKIIYNKDNIENTSRGNIISEYEIIDLKNVRDGK